MHAVMHRIMSAKSEYGPLVRMMPVDVMVPTTAGLTLALPSSGNAEKDHNPFGTPVTMAGIQDQLLVLASLQKPKKVRQHLCRWLAAKMGSIQDGNCKCFNAISICTGSIACVGAQQGHSMRPCKG